MPEYDNIVTDVTVERNANEHNTKYAVGEPMKVCVKVSRVRRGEVWSYKRTIVYRIRHYVAFVESVTPTFPETARSQPEFRPEHVGAMLNETDAIVEKCVPEVEAVEPIGLTIRSARHEQAAKEAEAEADAEAGDEK